MAPGTQIRLPSATTAHPARVLLVRIGLALGLLVLVALVAFLGGDGYRDGDATGLSLLDAFYYATVSITTTGYGDITPVSDAARLLNIFIITPARVLFLILLVGTTLEVLAAGTREAIRNLTWRRSLRDHTIVCGYGVKGRSAIEVLLGQGVERDRIVVIDPDPAAVGDANRHGFAAILGDASRAEVLREAEAEQAEAVIVAPHRDDAAVLMTLTARELNAGATIVAAVREEENKHLLHQGGANSVITSSGAAGRMLGFATRTPRVVEVLEDLLSLGEGLDIVEREVTEDGSIQAAHAGAPVIAVIRGERLLRFDDPEAQQLRAGDRVVCLCSNAG